MKAQETRNQIRNNLSSNLRKYRAVQRISQQKLARKIGVNQSVIARIENGSRKMLAEELPVFAEALKVSVNELLN